MDAVTVLEMHALIAQFESYLREERMRSPRTVSRYLKTMDQFTGFLGDLFGEGAFRVEEIGRDTLVAFLKSMSRGTDAAPSATAWNLALSVLRTFYKSLLEADRIKENPALRVAHQRVYRREPNPLSLDEMLAIVEAAESRSPARLRTRNLALLKVMMHCGLRVAEVASLTMEQVDLEGGFLRNVRRKGSKYLSIEINDVVREALELYLADRPQLLQGPAQARLLLSKRKGPLTVRGVQEVVYAYVDKASLSRGVWPHVLRHSSATLLSAVGKADLRTIQGMLGHESVATTQHYVHETAALRREASSAVSRAWKRRELERKRTRKGTKLSDLVPCEI